MQDDPFSQATGLDFFCTLASNKMCCDPLLTWTYCFFEAFGSVDLFVWIRFVVESFRVLLERRLDFIYLEDLTMLSAIDKNQVTISVSRTYDGLGGISETYSAVYGA